MRLLIIVLMFFVIGALLVISNNNLVMYNQENFGKFSELYLEWFDNLYANSRILTGEITKLKWLPK